MHVHTRTHTYLHTCVHTCICTNPFLRRTLTVTGSDRTSQLQVDVAEPDGVGKKKESGKPILWLRWHHLAESSGRDSGSGERGSLTFHRTLGWEVRNLLCAESLLCTFHMKTPWFRLSVDPDALPSRPAQVQQLTPPDVR